MTTAAIYVRCSTEEQAQKDLSLPAQEAACREWAERNECAVVAVFADAGVSGGSDDRPGVHAMLAAAADGGFERVLMWDSSRLARDEELAPRWERMLRAAGAEPTYITQPFIDASPEGRLVGAQLAAVNAYQRRRVSVDTRRTLREAVTGKHHWSGGQAPFGFRLVEKRLEVDEAEAGVVREIARLRLDEGLGLVRLAAHLNARNVPTPSGQGQWTQAHLHRVLTNRALCGVLCYDSYPRGRGGPRERVEVPGGCSEIITPEEFAALGLSRRAPKWRVPGECSSVGPIPVKRRRTHVLAGLLRCCACKAPMRWQGGGRSGRPDYYVCQGWRGKSGGCRGPWLRAEVVEAAVLHAMLGEVLTQEGIAALAERIEREELGADDRERRSRSRRQSRLARCEAEIGRLTAAIAHGGVLESLLSALREREGERDALRSELSLRETAGAPGRAEGQSVASWCEQTRAELLASGPARQNALLSGLLEHATYDPRSERLTLTTFWPLRTSGTSASGRAS